MKSQNDNKIPQNPVSRNVIPCKNEIIEVPELENIFINIYNDYDNDINDVIDNIDNSINYIYNNDYNQYNNI